MKIALLILLIVGVLGFACMWYALSTAEEGYQDEDGYHTGKEEDKNKKPV